MFKKETASEISSTVQTIHAEHILDARNEQRSAVTRGDPTSEEVVTGNSHATQLDNLCNSTLTGLTKRAVAINVDLDYH